MDRDPSNLVTVFAYGLTDAASGKSPFECAQERGWVDAAGQLTPAGVQLSKALSDQSATRSVFRIG